MKRAFPQKIQSVSLPAATQDVAVESSKQTAPETHRRVRTSAAMIGLAISMGASSLLLPRQSDRAIATEPLATDPSIATASGSSASEAALSSSPEVEPITAMSPSVSTLGGGRIIQAGQKLDWVAPSDRKELTTANSYVLGTPLQTGRVLRTASATNEVNSVKPSSLISPQLEPNQAVPGEVGQFQRGPIGEIASPLGSADDLLKAEQDDALNRLKQKREQLRNSLTQLHLENKGATLAKPEGVSKNSATFAVPQPGANGESIAYYPLVESVPSNSSPALTSSEQAQPDEFETESGQAFSTENRQEPALNAVKPSWQQSRGTNATQTVPQVVPIPVASPLPIESQASLYQVKPGDTFEAIARRHGLTKAELLQANRLSDPDRLSVDQVLRIPPILSDRAVPPIVSLTPEVEATPKVTLESVPSSIAEPAAELQSPASEVAEDSTPEVVSSESAEEIKASVPETEATSNSSTESLEAEIQSLREKYQTPAVVAQAEPQPETAPVVSLEVASASEPQVNQLPTNVEYRVSPGDTLDAIARRYGVTRAELLQANQITNPNLIKVDQVLSIPQTQSTPVRNQAVVVIPSFGTSADATSVASAEPVPVITPAAVAAPLRSAPAPSTVAANSQSSSTFSPARKQAAYVEGLLGEINRMRQQYQGGVSSSSTTEQAVPVVPSLATTSANNGAVNPEFKPDAYREALQAEIRRVQENKPSAPAQSQAATNAAAPAKAPARTSAQQVAVAPLPPESYNPTLQPSFGRIVSPDLPPLAPADRYLPEGAPAFNGYIWPAQGVLTSGYGWRWGRMHKGIDVAGPVGTPIVAAAAGVVDYAGWNPGGYGNLVDIRHPDGSLTRYAHNNRLLVRVGQRVEQGQQIAEMGSTGYSTGPHLHFEVHPAGQGAVNPIAFLPR